MRNCQNLAQSPTRAVRDELVELFPKILESYQNGNGEVRQILLQELDTKTKKMKYQDKILLYRSCTSFLQTQQDYWNALDNIAKLDKKLRDMRMDLSKKKTLTSLKMVESLGKQNNYNRDIEDKLLELEKEREVREKEFWALLAKEVAPVTGEGVNDPFKPGPVGESPVHICFLLRLTDIGKEVIEKYYPDKKSLNVAYKNDLLPLQPEDKSDKQKKTSSEPEGDLSPPETGLYTGETLLHIAIVNEDIASVQYLLEKGMKISSRATGVFFQPRWIRPRVKDLTRWQRFLSWMAGVDLKVEKFAVVAQELNEYSACYYGEYPLSFAASIGSVEICKLLLSFQESRKADTVELVKKRLSRIGRSQTFVQHNQHWKHDDSRTPLWDFMNAIDYYGNTALHMAVYHRKKDVIDWLMTKEAAKASLEILNFDGFTPLTYAARLGYVDIFNHILFKYLSRTGWTYGKVSLRRQ